MSSAQAATADAREVARLNNCPPKKIEVFQQGLGAISSVTYRVTCNMPKAVDQPTPVADALLVQCIGSMCEMLRPISLANK